MANWQEIVQKLLNKAEDSATTAAERETIQDRVTYLMAKFNISVSMFHANSGVEHNVIRVVYKISAPYANQKGLLLNGIATTFGCKLIRTNTGYVIFGYENDQEKVFLLYHSIDLQMTLTLARAQANKPPHEHGKTFNVSFVSSYVNTVINRVAIAYARARTEANAETTTGAGTDIVLRNRARKVSDALNAEFPEIKITNVRATQNSYSGRTAGQTAGNSANIGQTGVAGGRKAIS